MAFSLSQAKITGLTSYFPAVTERYQEIYEANRQRVYSFAFWMSDNELLAEELMANVFRRAFAASAEPTADMIDRAFINEIRETIAVGELTLPITTCTEVAGVRRNVKRVLLERAVVQLPATEKLIYLMHDGEAYDHARIARLLGISETDSAHGLHAARLQLREVLARME